MFRIYPYKVGSASVKKLKGALNALIIKTEGSRYVPKPQHIVINWGNSTTPDWMVPGSMVLNSPENVALTVDKIKTLAVLQDNLVPTVPFTRIKETAQQWVDNGHRVFARKTVTGHSGEGIEVIEPNDIAELTDVGARAERLGLVGVAEQIRQRIEEATEPQVPDAPLYTMGIENKGEYRVHVFDSSVILYQKKSRRVDDDGNVITAEGEEALVRNLASNWVYRTGNLRRLDRVEELAIDAIDALGLDFGAVDIIMDENGDVYVLEVNSAPGLGNDETLNAYVRAFTGQETEQEEEDEDIVEEVF